MSCSYISGNEGAPSPQCFTKNWKGSCLLISGNSVGVPASHLAGRRDSHYQSIPLKLPDNLIQELLLIEKENDEGRQRECKGENWHKWETEAKAVKATSHSPTLMATANSWLTSKTSKPNWIRKAPSSLPTPQFWENKCENWREKKLHSRCCASVSPIRSCWWNAIILPDGRGAHLVAICPRWWSSSIN